MTGMGSNVVNETVANINRNEETRHKFFNFVPLLHNESTKHEFFTILFRFFWSQVLVPHPQGTVEVDLLPSSFISLSQLAKDNNQPKFGAGLAPFYLLGIWGRKQGDKEGRVGLQLF